jgi:hypothetical protein
MTAKSPKAPTVPAAYAVGYKKPPLETRFKKGNRGNPRGRPRPSRNLTALLLEALDRRVTVTEDGRRRRRARRELGVVRLADQFAAGDQNASRLVFALIEELERRSPPAPQQGPPYDEADTKVIDTLRARWGGG